MSSASGLRARFGYVFLGGALGGMLRYFLEEIARLNLLSPVADWTYLFVVNLAGAFLLGLTARHPYFDAGSCRFFWASGFAGGFTTMSALTLLLFDRGWNPLIWLMLVLGLVSYGLGYRLGQRSARHWTEKQAQAETAG